MRKPMQLAIVLTIVLAGTAYGDYMNCSGSTYWLAGWDIDVFGNFWPVIRELPICYLVIEVVSTTPPPEGSSTTGGSSGGGGGPGVINTTPPSPDISIESVSDADPNDVVLQIVYSVNLTRFIRYTRNGSVIFETSPTNYVHVGSLQHDLWRDDNTMTVAACNGAGCNEATAHVYRKMQARSDNQQIWFTYLMWEASPDEPLHTNLYAASYAHWVTGDFLYASYNVQTTGARNGKVMHVESQATLGASGDTPKPGWTSAWQMHTSDGTVIALQTGTCNRNQNTYTVATSLCSAPERFALDGDSAGSHIIQHIGGISNVYWAPDTIGPVSGATTITLNP